MRFLGYDMNGLSFLQLISVLRLEDRAWFWKRMSFFTHREAEIVGEDERECIRTSQV